MSYRVTRDDRFGFVRPVLDAHTLGISSVSQVLKDCGFHIVLADAKVCEAIGRPADEASMTVIEQWIRGQHITVLGFSYRLDPGDGATLFGQFVHRLKTRRILRELGGPLKAIHFAGLPKACDLVRQQVPEVAQVFRGDETPDETLRLLGVVNAMIPRELSEVVAYDEDRLAFGRDLLRRADYLGVKPVDRSSYESFGTQTDTLMARMRHGREHHLPPVMRTHIGPYLSDRSEAVRLFFDWTRKLAAAGFLDVLSIGTSQLTQSAFGEEWGNRPNGGGVPLNSRDEFAAVWQVARPMLVRSYAGTRNIPELAKMYEETIHIAWHTLSLWWFCRIDGRGSYSVYENLQQHIETLRYIATTGKPYEPNVSHHFAFRGGDDVTCVVSAVLAARVAKALGVRYLVLQTMLNTPKAIWGVQDLAKARATLRLVRELENDRLCVILQPRGGLDYFSHDLDRAKAQLVAVTALMDDIEPRNLASPPIIHVVSYSEASHLADPQVVNESIQITRHALAEYRRLRVKGDVDDMTDHPEVTARTAELVAEARTVLQAIEASVRQPYSPRGLYEVLARGFLTVPYLWECKDEFRQALQWPTRLVRGSMKVIAEDETPLSAEVRMQRVISGATVPVPSEG